MSLRQGFAKIAMKIGLPGPLKHELQAAVDKNDDALVTELLKASPGMLKKADGSYDTALLSRAVNWGNKKSAKALADFAPGLLTQGDNNGATLLMQHARAPVSANSFNLLLGLYTAETAQGTDKGGNNVLHYAARVEGEPFTMQMLLEVVPHLATAANNDGETPIIEVGRTGVANAAMMLMSKGASLNATDIHGLNATMHAIRHSNLKTAGTLIGWGGVVDFGDPAIETQMRVASFEADINFLQQLNSAKDRQNQQEHDRRIEVKAAQVAATAKAVSDISAGIGDDVAAPTRATFIRRKKPGADI